MSKSIGYQHRVSMLLLKRSLELEHLDNQVIIFPAVAKNLFFKIQCHNTTRQHLHLNGSLKLKEICAITETNLSLVVIYVDFGCFRKRLIAIAQT